MRVTKLDVSEGAYNTSYFSIHISTLDSMLDKLHEHNQTFVHEYIHFLQDLLLSYNLRLNLIQQRRFALVASIADQEGFVRPFNQWDDDSNLTNKQFEYTWGGTKHIDEEEARIISLCSSSFVIPDTDIRVYEYTAWLDSDKSYLIGARDMLEYIAHKIESNHWETGEPAFPYRSLDKVFDYLDLSEMPGDCRIALVEFCLHNDHPFHHMLKVVELAFGDDRRSRLFDSANIDETLKSIHWGSVGGFQETIKTKTQRRLGELSAMLKERFHANNFSSISSWVDDVIELVQEDFCGELFFTELYRMDKDSFFSTIYSLIDRIGVPIILNDNDEMTSLLPEKYDSNQFIQFHAAQKFLEYISHDGKTCPLIAVCETNNDSIINDDCYNNAIVRGLDDELCPFGQLVRTYNLHKVK